MNFEKPSIETLKTFIQKELKDELFEEKLIRPSDGIIIEPIYQDLENNKVNIARNTDYFTYFENFKIQLCCFCTHFFVIKNIHYYL